MTDRLIESHLAFPRLYLYFPAATVVPVSFPAPARVPSSEEVQAKLAAHAEVLRKQAQEAAAVLNMPSYINPSVVNPHQYAVQQHKRKLLWGSKKSEVRFIKVDSLFHVLLFTRMGTDDVNRVLRVSERTIAFLSSTTLLLM